ncbi:MAG: DUF3800 domain-containing protein [Janthinobacterium lividum]
MKYILYLDESGDHGLSVINPDFPVFVLCGILVKEAYYEEIRQNTNAIKRKYWGDKGVVFHSRDIRKCQKEFAILLDPEVKAAFYTDINNLITNSPYTIIASAIHKERHIKSYGTIADDPYEIALSFVVERSIFALDAMPEPEKQLSIVLEMRGGKEDKKLTQHFEKLLARGAGYINAERLAAYKITLQLKSKKENINGLQLSDLVAYPIARYVLDPNRANPAFDLLKAKFRTSQRGFLGAGLKIFP